MTVLGCAFALAAFEKHGTDFPGRPGWRLLAQELDFGTQIGVAAWNGERGVGCRRSAVRMKKPCLVEDAIPALTDWIDNT